MKILKEIDIIISNKNKNSLYFLLFLMITVMMVEVLSLGLIIPVLTVVIDPDSVEKFLEIEFLNKISFSGEKLSIILLAGLILAFFIKSLIIFFMNWKQSKIMFEINTELAKIFYTFYLNSDYEFHLNNNSSKMVRNISSEIPVVTTLINSLCSITAEIIVLSGITVFLFVFNPLGTLMITIVLIILGLILHLSIKKKLNMLGEFRKRHERLRIKNLLNGFRGIKEIMISSYQNSFVNDYDKHHKGVYGANMSRNILLPIPRLAFEFSGVLILSIFTLVGVYLNYSSVQLITTLSVWAVAAIRLLPSFNRISSNLQNITVSKPSLNELLKDYIYLNNAKKKNKIDKNLKSIKLEKIVLDKVCFNYSNSSNSIIKEASFEIKKGTKNAIIGKTGSGKSTLLDLIVGLIKPQAGKIKFDGQFNSNCQKDLQKNIGYVPQRIYLVDDTIKQNVAFGIPRDEIDDKKVEYAIEFAQLKNFVDSLENGFDTIVGDDGVKISGGQKQRIGIARALYKDPQIIVLDEATNAIDEDTENKLISNLVKIEKQKTLIMVTHRKNILKDFDNIFLVQNGRVAKANKDLQYFNQI